MMPGLDFSACSLLCVWLWFAFVCVCGACLVAHILTY